MPRHILDRFSKSFSSGTRIKTEIEFFQRCAIRTEIKCKKGVKRIKLFFPVMVKARRSRCSNRLDALMPQCHYVTAPCDFFGFRDKRGSPKTRKFVRLGALAPRLPSYYMPFRLSETLQPLVTRIFYIQKNNKN